VTYYAGGLDALFGQPRAYLAVRRQIKVTYLWAFAAIIEMIWWTGLAPRDFEFPFPGSLISTFLGPRRMYRSCETDFSRNEAWNFVTYGSGRLSLPLSGSSLLFRVYGLEIRV